MALQPMMIYKLLPKKNCKECGVATCLAFAMKLAEGKVELALCPYLSAEAKNILGLESGPSVVEVRFGPAEREVILGGETVLYRHEKRFVNPTAIGILIDDNLSQTEMQRRLDLSSHILERTGMKLGMAYVVLRADEDNGDVFGWLVDEAVKRNLPVLLQASPDLCRLALGRGLVRPLIHSSYGQTEELLKLAGENALPVVVSGETLNQIAENALEAEKHAIKDIVIEPIAENIKDRTAMMVACRRSAVLKRDAVLGRPLLWQERESDNELCAQLAVMRYASLLSLRDCDLARLTPLLVLEQEIYSDPQKPISLSPGLYPIGNPGADSPVLITTNFSLTYFLVSGDAEASGIPCHLLLIEVEGQSVLTAFASGKLTAEKAAETIQESGIADRLNHRRLIIPGLISRMSGKLEDASGWQVDVGPQDSSRLPGWLKNYSTVSGSRG